MTSISLTAWPGNITDWGTVTSFNSKKSSSLDTTGLPDDDSAAAIVMDLDGVIRTISISGSYVGDETALNAFTDALDKLVNGSQFVNDPYTLSVTGVPNRTYYVICSDVDWTVSDESPNKVDWSVSFTEGVTA